MRDVVKESFPKGLRAALIQHGYRTWYIKGLERTRNYRPTLKIYIQDPRKETGNAIRSLVTAEEQAPPSTAFHATGNEPLGARAAKAVNDEPGRSLPVEVELLEKGRLSAIRCRGRAMTPARVPC
jgi:hypothetical protein